MRRFLFLSLGLAAVFSCSTSRKISQVGLREPSSVRATELSALRSKVGAATEKDVPKACPGPVRELLPALALERLRFLDCPAGLAPSFQAALPYLKLEERSTLEEALNSQCRSLGFTEFGDSLEQMVANFDSSGPLGRRMGIVQTLLPTTEETKALESLKTSLQELVDYHLPLDRWSRRNGDFVLPEDELVQLNRLVFERGCKMSDEELDQSYRTVRSLEELSKILKEGDQQERVLRFIGGVHTVIERRLKEFFYP